MKFKTRKDPLLTTLIGILILILTGFGIVTYTQEGFTADVITVNIVSLFLVIFFIGTLSTPYQLTNVHLKY